MLHATTHYGDSGVGLVLYRNVKDICEEGRHISQFSLAISEEGNFTKRLQPMILKAKLMRYRLIQKVILHPVTNTEKLKYLQKSKNLDNIQDRRVAKLKTVGHMYINMIFRFLKIWATLTGDHFTPMPNIKYFALYVPVL